MPAARGLLAVVIVAALLSVPMYCYWQTLTRGMRPPETTQILNRLEKTGVPDFAFPTLEGKSVSVSEFKGKVLLINLWATWCAPCVKEFPSLSNLVERFKGRVVVLAVSHDRDREDIVTFVKAFGDLPKDFVIVWDKERTSGKLLGTDALPETYILSPEQKLLRKIAGETIWDNAMAVQFFDEILNPETSLRGREK